MGLAVLLCASTALEWSRLYRFEAAAAGPCRAAPGLSGGAHGRAVAGFTGSGLVFIALTVLGAALVFRFSWSHVAERVGAWIDGLIESRREKREMAEDLAWASRPPASARKWCSKSA
jgi:S-DNA-T family DNA segregation ATPase FtsK/SpoIIIE